MNGLFHGPKHAYPKPEKLTDYAFQVKLVYLDREGHEKRGDSTFSYRQFLPMIYSKDRTEALEDSEDLIFVAQYSPFEHPKRRLNLKNHEYGIALFISCNNDNEQMNGQQLFRSHFTHDGFKTLLLEGTDRIAGPDGNAELRLIVPGDCPMTNSGSDKMKLALKLSKDSLSCFVEEMELHVDHDFMVDWEHRCTT